MFIKPVTYVIGILIVIFGISMTIPALFDYYHQHDNWLLFAKASVFTVFFGGITLIISQQNAAFSLTRKQGFLLTALSWISLAVFSAIPLWFSNANLSFTDAFFEATSGITTTGATVMTQLDSLSHGILIWRSLLQWLGGIGIIAMAISILPFLKVGGMQLFQTESSENEKALPRITQIATYLVFIYVALTIACLVSYSVAGMTTFDALAHAMTTISTGGFSTHDKSIGAFDGTYIDLVAVLFILLSALPFAVYIKLVRGDSGALIKDSQIKGFFLVIVVATLILALFLTLTSQGSFSESLRKSLFQVVTITTGTGYGIEDFALWGGFASALMFLLMFVGGCAGSTTCSVKIFRYQVLYRVAVAKIKELLYPHGVFVPRYNTQKISFDVAFSVSSFVFVYFLSFAVIALLLLACNLDSVTALSAAASALSNVGPGIGSIIGPAGTYAPLPDTAKWILCAAMILGRLELFTFFVLFSTAFWKK